LTPLALIPTERACSAAASTNADGFYEATSTNPLNLNLVFVEADLHA
jgi:hypothetical protein